MPEQVKKDAQLKFICPECGKPRATKGSMTGWLFSEKNCTCVPLHMQFAPKKQTELIEVGETPGLPGEDTLGPNYEFLSLLGRGGMGSVYKVHDRRLSCNFAVKIMNPELASDVDALKRFYKECDAASKLTHPNIVAVYGHGQTEGGSPYFIMDYIEGEPLSDVLEREVYIGVNRALSLFIQIAEALAHAHSKSLIHRDLKPANIVLAHGETEIVKLVDFGIAKVLESQSRVTQDLTQAGEIMGTPLYMSPEQCLGFHLDARSDIYSLGCLMCESLTGRPPFSGDNPMQIIAHHLNDSPIEACERFSRFDVPPGLQDVIFTCLAKEPADRYQSTDELLQDLIAVQDGKRPSVGTSYLSTTLRSPVTGVVLELLPFVAPVLILTVDSFINPMSQRKVIDHCIWAAAMSLVVSAFYVIKGYYLESISPLIDKYGNHYQRKIKSYFATAVSAFLFGLSQSLVYMDFFATRVAQGTNPEKYCVPWWVALLWLSLAAFPLIIAKSTKDMNSK